MTQERWNRVKELLVAAWEREGAADRAAYLDEACAGDAELRARVEALLASDEKATAFLREPALGNQTAIRSMVQSALAEPEGTAFDWTGKRLGPYVITGLIGKGGMGAVYSAEREDDFRMQVAIKVLKRGTDTEAAVTRFRAERQILAGLQHPNVTLLLDGGVTDDGLPYFVMEYVDGAALLDYAAGLPVRRRLELFRSICSAVDMAHQNNIVHRDIKPANILVTAKGVPKVLDFGIAKLLDAEPSDSGAGLTATGVRLMTPAYASPEQAAGHTVTAASDVYSLGLVLYELLTGRRAHPLEEHSESAVAQVFSRPLKKPSALNPQLDSDLDNIVFKAIRAEPERRYQSAGELSEDLDRFLQHLPVRARRDGWIYRARKFLQRNWAPVTASAATAALVLGGVAGLGRFRRSESPRTQPRSIAVLPLENLSGDREQEYFADGITDSLIGDLAQVPGLLVISRTSSMSYKGTRRLPEIAQRLHVRTVVEGSVLRNGSRIRLAVRLVDAAADRPLWSASYEGELRDVVSLQERVTAAIAHEIGITLNAREQERVFRRQRVDVGAYDAYLKGRHQYFTGFTEDSTNRAIAYFQQALAIDPSYAPAYAGLADCYFGMSNIYKAPTEVMPKAQWAARRALDLDDRLGEAYASLALVQSVFEFNREAAERGFRRGLELQASNAEAHLWYSQHLAGLGRFDEAVSQLGQAEKLDPASPAVSAYAGLILFLARRNGEIIERLQPISDLHPDYHHPYAWLGLAYEQRRQWPQAIAAMGKAYALDGEPEALAQLGHIYAGAGNRADALNVLGKLRQLSRRRYVSAYNFAVLYAGLGQTDDAFEWLQKVEQDRSEWFAAVNVDPRLDVLHSDPRFAAVLRSVGLGH